MAMTNREIVTWCVYTRIRSDPWRKQLHFFYLDQTLNLQEIIDRFIDEVNKVIPLKHIADIEEALQNLQDALRGNGWGEEAPKCMIELSKGISKYKIIVRLLESGKKIDNLCLELPDEVNSENIGEYMDHLFSEGVFSGLNIINKDDFYTMLHSVLSGSAEDESEVETDD
jgi:hypothetical protein